MTAILVAYGTGEGQTAEVAEYIDSVLSERGYDVTTADVAKPADISIEDHDAVLVGGSVNNRRQRPEVIAFVETHREALASRPSGFFQLSMASAFQWRWAREGAVDFVDALVEETGWQPDRVGLFAGAVKYTQYDPLMRLAFKLVSVVTTGDTDTSRDYEYTDWDEVERFAVEFGEFADADPRRERASVTRRFGGTGAFDRRRVVAAALLATGAAGAAYWIAGRRERSRPETTDDRDRRPSDVSNRGRSRTAG